jgi:hypothetical protein
VRADALPSAFFVYCFSQSREDALRRHAARPFWRLGVGLPHRL